MSLRRTIATVVLLCVVAALCIYAYAYHTHHVGVSAPIPSSHKIAPATIEDGSYVVRVHSIITTGEDTSITFAHVTYFNGTEASSSAMKEVDCPDDRPIEACVPTLTKGYYVRESGAPTFTAPLTLGTRISLRDDSEATVDDLRSLDRQFEPVFDVSIKDGNIYSLAEKSPL
jgi:hypothetical protein